MYVCVHHSPFSILVIITLIVTPKKATKQTNKQIQQQNKPTNKQNLSIPFVCGRENACSKHWCRWWALCWRCAALQQRRRVLSCQSSCSSCYTGEKTQYNQFITMHNTYVCTCTCVCTKLMITAARTQDKIQSKLTNVQPKITNFWSNANVFFISFLVLTLYMYM